MTPGEIADRFPRLFHITRPGALADIERHGLLSAGAALDLFDVPHGEAERFVTTPRPTEVTIRHPEHGTVTLGDNTPMAIKALETCLDDGLAPADWLRIINSKVFFWADESGLARLLNSRLNRDRNRDILVLDTLPLAKAHIGTIAFSPINSGSTIRRPARRGLATFSRMQNRTYDEWRRQRGRLDKVLEITVDHAVPDAARYVTEVREVRR